MRNPLLLIAIIFAICLSSFAQNAQSTPSLNRSFLRYFSANELNQIESDQPAFHEVLSYYMTSSFTVENLDCPNCVVDYNDFYNHALFNVNEHESKRKPSIDSVFVYKLNYLVKIKSSIEMQSHLSGYTPEQIVNYVSPRSFPVWISSSDNQIDYTNYKADIRQWAKDFPDAYREITNSPELRKVRFEEFIKFPVNKRDQLLNGPDQYMIID